MSPDPTERLYFRELTPDDIHVMWSMHTDEKVMKHLGMPPWNSVQEGIDYIYRNIRSYKAHAFGRWVVLRKSDDAWIGLAGLLIDQHEGFVDLGYRLLPEFWGCGYATEAAYAVLKYGFEVLQLDRIVAQVAIGNVASESVVRKLGMHYTGIHYCMGMRAGKFEITATDFLSLVK